MTMTRNAAASPNKSAPAEKLAPLDIVLTTIDEPTLSSLESEQETPQDQVVKSKKTSKKHSNQDPNSSLLEREKSIAEREKRLALKEKKLKEREKDLKKFQPSDPSAPGPSRSVVGSVSVAPVSSGSSTSVDSDSLTAIEKLRRASASKERDDGIINQCPASFTLEMSNLALDVGAMFTELPHQIMLLLKDETAVRSWLDRVKILSKKLASCRRLYAERVSDEDTDDGFFTIKEIDSWVGQFLDKFNQASLKKFCCSDLKAFFQGETQYTKQALNAALITSFSVKPK